MKVLILGGTRFLGRHLVEEGRRLGHAITLFHRGRTGLDLYPEVERILGDRDGGLRALEGRRWDAAVDTCGYVPRLVKMSAEALADAVSHYTFVSSISVYARLERGVDEREPVATLQDPATEAITPETYGALKALCERAAEEAMPGRVLSVRAGLIVGPHDTTDRFTYWVRRVSMGGRVLVPGPPERPIQLIHAADLARWIYRMAEARQAGVYNATGPPEPHTMEGVVAACREASGSRAVFVWADPGFLAERGAAYWSELPLVADDVDGALAADVLRAVAKGLVQRPLALTVRETLAWDASRPAGTRLAAGLPPEKEAALLAAWEEGRP